jgi:hypothetical protein
MYDLRTWLAVMRKKKAAGFVGMQSKNPNKGN